ncbi:MAG: S1 RNA-binding domain-containing protein [Oscillospiraceae bacterium]|nr:S1 RNA-binding domain-containing protein [Oscillospiraceae bacterium]
MDFEVGAILTGNVTGITKFGAFVMIAPGKSGLVHISEIANSYVNDVSDFLAEGQEVTVKVIGVDNSGRLNLSIKAAVSAPAAPKHPPARPQYKSQQNSRQSPVEPAQAPSFEDKLKRFMQDSDSKISDLKQYSAKKGARRRGR